MKSQRGFQAAFYFSIGTLWRKKNFEKFLNFLWTFFWSISVIMQEKFGRPIKTAFSVSMETFFSKKTVMENKGIFLSISDTNRSFRPHVYFLAGWLKLHSTCPQEHFREKKCFSKPTVFQWFWTTNEIFSKSCRKKFNGFVKNKNCRFEKIFLGQFFIRLFF